MEDTREGKEGGQGGGGQDADMQEWSKEDLDAALCDVNHCSSSESMSYSAPSTAASHTGGRGQRTSSAMSSQPLSHMHTRILAPPPSTRLGPATDEHMDALAPQAPMRRGTKGRVLAVSVSGLRTMIYVFSSERATKAHTTSVRDLASKPQPSVFTSLTGWVMGGVHS